MKPVTFFAVVAVIPAALSAALYYTLAPGLGEPEAASVALFAFAAAALAGRHFQRKYWAWGKHQLLTGQDAARFLGQVTILHVLTAGSYWLGHKLSFDRGFEFPALGGLSAALVAFPVISFFFFSREYTPYIRGTNLLGLEEAREKAALALKTGDCGFPFGGARHPSPVALMHFLVVGAVGSGKTKTLEALMRHMLPTLNTLDGRAVVYDPKREFLRYLDSLALGRRVIVFDPTDARCHAWALALDIEDEDDARAWAEITVPKNEHASQPFFDNAARELLISVVTHLQRKMPGRWTLRLVVHVMLSPGRIRALLSTTREGRETLELYFSKEKTAQDVMSTIATAVGPYKSVARAWDRAEREARTFSIKEWMNANDVILLGSSNKAGPTVRDLNRLFLTRVSQVILDEPDNDQAELLSPKSRRHYLFLDEVRFAGKLDCLSELFLKGRSKGVVLAVAVQDRKGMQAVYGENIADEQLSQAATIGVLRLQNTDTAKWAASLIGQYEALQLSHSSGPEGKGNDTATPTVKDVVLPSEVMRLPLAGPENGISGYFLCPTVGVWHGAVPWKQVMAERAPVRESTLENYVRRQSDSKEELRPWTDREMEELGVAGNELADGQAQGPTPEQEARALLDIAPIDYEEAMN